MTTPKKPTNPNPVPKWMTDDDELIKEAFYHAIQNREVAVYKLKDSVSPHDKAYWQEAQAMLDRLRGYWKRRGWGW